MRYPLANIKEIAEMAGVVPSTVSNVLNNSKYVSDDIKARVYQAVEQLGYQPNLVARSLKTKQTHTIGIVIPEFNIFFTEIINAIENYMYRRDYTIIVCCTSENRTKEKKYLENLKQRSIDGLIFLGTGQDSDDLLKNYPVPVVIVDRPVGRLFPSVTIDNILGGYLATRHLLERGARRIALFMGHPSAKTNTQRAEGYQKALNEYGIKSDTSLEQQMEKVCYESGWSAAKRLQEEGILFDGIFCTNHFFAVGALKYLVKKGVSVPEDVKIVGFDGSPISEMMMPELSTIVQPKKEMGEKAAEILLHLIENKGGIQNKDLVELTVQFKPKLVVRESS